MGHVAAACAPAGARPHNAGERAGDAAQLQEQQRDGGRAERAVEGGHVLVLQQEALGLVLLLRCKVGLEQGKGPSPRSCTAAKGVLPQSMAAPEGRPPLCSRRVCAGCGGGCHSTSQPWAAFKSTAPWKEHALKLSTAAGAFELCSAVAAPLPQGDENAASFPTSTKCT